MSEIPLTIIVSANEYTVELAHKINDETHGECKGLTHDDRKVIELDKNMKDSEASIILMHELIHTMYSEYGLNAVPATEERVCTILAPAIHNLFVDNPDFMDYFISNVEAMRERKSQKQLTASKK